MPRRYIHLFGNAACEDILQAYGLVEKDSQTINGLQSKHCPNCNEPNKPDSKFCAKCRMVLTYDAYSETIEQKRTKEKDVETLKEDIGILKETISDMQNLLRNPHKLAEITQP